MRRYTKTVGGDRLARVAARGPDDPDNRHPERSAAAGPRRHKLDQRLDAEQIAEIVAGYEAGSHSAELSRRFGVSKTSVIKILREAGVAIRRQGLSDADAARTEHLYLSGLSMAQAAEELDSAASTVCFVLRQRGVRTRPRPDGRIQSPGDKP